MAFGPNDWEQLNLREFWGKVDKEEEGVVVNVAGEQKGGERDVELFMTIANAWAIMIIYKVTALNGMVD